MAGRGRLSGRRSSEYEASRRGMGPRVATAPYPFRLMPGIPGNYHLHYKGYSQPEPYPHKAMIDERGLCPSVDPGARLPVPRMATTLHPSGSSLDVLPSKVLIGRFAIVSFPLGHDGRGLRPSADPGALLPVPRMATNLPPSG